VRLSDGTAAALTLFQQTSQSRGSSLPSFLRLLSMLPRSGMMASSSGLEEVVVRQADAWSLMNIVQRETYANRRRAPRSWVRRSGQLIIVRGLRGISTIDCQVLNTSIRGALIKVVCASDIPDDFYLIIDGQPERKITCSVARRSQKLLGVRFVPQF
jgi:hypothetical protein